MSRNVFFFFCLDALQCSSTFSPFVVSQSGCKSSYSFLTGKKFLKFFFEKFIFRFLLFFSSVCQGTLHVLRGAKVSHVFKSHKLFLIFFENKFSTLIRLTCQCFKERTRCCGCKSSAFIRFDNDFF